MPSRKYKAETKLRAIAEGESSHEQPKIPKNPPHPGYITDPNDHEKDIAEEAISPSSLTYTQFEEEYIEPFNKIHAMIEALSEIQKLKITEPDYSEDTLIRNARYGFINNFILGLQECKKQREEREDLSKIAIEDEGNFVNITPDPKLTIDQCNKTIKSIKKIVEESGINRTLLTEIRTEILSSMDIAINNDADLSRIKLSNTVKYYLSEYQEQKKLPKESVKRRSSCPSICCSKANVTSPTRISQQAR
ncbi:hypothetical protein N8772_04615 [Rickettsiales bacterium]|nr:hypothetical protein [Rickettsiales bacterium]MDB2550829.1 hypothetical protein [Rickettsiales bacterium]